MNVVKVLAKRVKASLHLQPKFGLTAAFRCQKNTLAETADQILTEDREYLSLSESYFPLESSKNCYIIQPYIKWGHKKQQDITPSEQLEEAKALISTLPSWSVHDTIHVPLESFDKKTLFGTGSLEKLRRTIHGNHAINAVFINLGKLKKAQFVSLEKEFGTEILDRYRVVMLILKHHATSKHAKLQVALAELYYLQRSIFEDHKFGKTVHEKLKLMFQSREQKLKSAFKELRMERALQRNRRLKNDYPVVAVVGYTNAGKTFLIKALTGGEGLQPKDQLFATLDVTLHEGLLPSGLKVLYVDTVGFISDIPTTLIECFLATLEDAILADVILHVEDLSSTCFEFKRKHVLQTLQDMSKKLGTTDIMGKVVSVGSKSDLISKEKDFGILQVSSKTSDGLDLLRTRLEDSILCNTNRRKITIRVPSGSDSMRWLYKNSTVISEFPDSKNPQFVLAKVIITEGRLQQFRHHFS